MSFSFEYFNSIDEFYKSINKPIKENFDVVLNKTGLYAVQRTFEKFERCNVMDGKELILLYLESDGCLLTDVFEKKNRMLNGKRDLKSS